MQFLPGTGLAQCASESPSFEEFPFAATHSVHANIILTVVE